MKHPFKIAGLLIIAGAILFAAWPNHTVRDHNPVTGEGAPGEEHDHGHLQPAPVPPPEEPAGILREEVDDEE